MTKDELKARAHRYYMRRKEKRHAEMLIRQAEYRAAHREELRAYHKAWRVANRERCRIHSKTSYHAQRDENVVKKRAYNNAHRDEIRAKARLHEATHRDQKLARMAAYRAANREQLRAKNRAYVRANPAKSAARTRRRQAAERQALPPWVNVQAITALYLEAAEKSAATGIKHVVDHIVPIRHHRVCGLHVPWNLQVLTDNENCHKSNKFPYHP